AEHELSVLRSRLAVNEGVTAVTGSILESLKGQFERRDKVDIATSPLDIYKHSLFYQSLSSQTSPMIETLPDIPESVEIHYDAQTVRSPYLLVKTKNTFWIAQPIATAEAQTHLQKFSSPVMKRATVKLPKTFDQKFLSDSDNEDEQITTNKLIKQQSFDEEKPLTIENVERLEKGHIQKFIKNNENNWSTEVLAPSVADESTNLQQQQSDNTVNNNQISPEDERSFPDLKEQISEMKTIRSSSIIQIEDQMEQFDDKIDEIYSIIDYLKNNKLTSTNFNNIQTKIHDLKLIMSDVQLNKTDELRIEYELDELENLYRTINENLNNNNIHQKEEDYSLIELFEQNVNELRRIINDIKSTSLQTNLTSNDLQIINENIHQQESKLLAEHDWTPEQMAEYFQRSPDGELLTSSRQLHSHLIPEDPVITREVFFEGDKSSHQEKKPSITHVTHLIPEDARISAENFYEGDMNRSLFQKETVSHEPPPPPLIPESPLVSSDVFYEGDPQRSMFIERPSLSHTESTAAESSSINNLRDIMSDLMLAASWSKKPTIIDEQTPKDTEEILAESFITTEQNYPTSSLCEILHEIENFPLTSNKRLSHPVVQIEERDTISPFSTASPTIIHRNILTRQETDRWAQDELLTSEEQNTDDWTNSSNQRKEIYGEQYRPERKFSDELSETTKQQLIANDIESKETVQQRDEDEQYHIERTWSTDKIYEPSVNTSDEVIIQSSYDDKHEEEDQHSNQFYIQAPQQVGTDQYQLQQRLITDENIMKPSDKNEDEHKLERQDSAEEINLQSQYENEHEEVEEQYQPERKVSADQAILETSQRIESDQSEPSSPSQEQLPIGLTHQIQEEKSDAEEESKSPRKLSTEQIVPEPSQLSGHQVMIESSPIIEHKDYDYEQYSGDKQTVIKSDEDVEEEHKLEQSFTFEKSDVRSQQLSEHEDDDQPQRKLSSTRISNASIPVSEHEEDKEQYQSEPSSPLHEQLSTGLTHQVREEKSDAEEESKSPRKLSTDHEEQHYPLERKLSVDEIVTESSPVIEHRISSGTASIDEKHQIERTPSSEKISIASLPASEREELELEEHENHTIKRQSSIDREDEEVLDQNQQKIITETQPDVEIPEQVTHTPERKLSTDQVSVKTSPTIEHQAFQDEHFSTYKEIVIPSDEEIHEEHQLDKSFTSEKSDEQSPRIREHEDSRQAFERIISSEEAFVEQKPEEERKFSSGKISIASLPVSEHEHEEHKLERSYGSDKIDLESPKFNEREFKQDQFEDLTNYRTALVDEKHDSERRLSSGKINIASLPLTEHEEHETQQHPHEDEHEQRPSSRAISITSHEEIEPEDTHKLTPKSSIGQLSTHSAQLSEHEVEQETRSTPERQLSTGRLSTESSPTIEHKDYQHGHLPTHEETLVKSHEETKQETPEKEEEHVLEQSFVSEKSNVESSHMSEHEDDEHHIISSKQASIVQTPEQERRLSS
ncbi:unnamed protein product, partial [Adineta steineri]